MKRFTFFGLFLLGLLFIGADFSVETDWNKSYDYAKLKTYSWAPMPQEKTGDPRLDNRKLDEAIRSTIDQSLAQRGYQKVSEGNPDFWVNYYAQIQGKLDVSEKKMPYYAKVTPQRGGVLSPTWNAMGDSFGSGRDLVSVSQYYEEGTLVLDIAEPAQKTLLWRGAVSGVVKPDISDDKRKKRINEAVEKLLKDFPPKASKQ